MDERNNEPAIMKYTKLSFNTLLILILLTSLTITIKGMIELGLSSVDCYVHLLNLLFKLLSLLFGVLFAAVLLNAEELKIDNYSASEYSLLNMLQSNNKKVKVEICSLLVSLYFFMLTGMTRELIYDQFGDYVYLPNYFIYSFIAVAFLAFGVKLYLSNSRKKLGKASSKK